MNKFEDNCSPKKILSLLVPFVIIVAFMRDIFTEKRFLHWTEIQYKIACCIKSPNNYKKVLKYYFNYLDYLKSSINKYSRLKQNDKRELKILDLNLKLAVNYTLIALCIDEYDTNNQDKNKYYKLAIDTYLSLPILENINEEYRKLGAIAKCYMYLKDYTNAIIYYDKAISYINYNIVDKANFAVFYYDKAAAMYKLNASQSTVLSLINEAKNLGYDENDCNEKIEIIKNMKKEQV